MTRLAVIGRSLALAFCVALLLPLSTARADEVPNVLKPLILPGAVSIQYTALRALSGLIELDYSVDREGVWQENLLRVELRLWATETQAKEDVPRLMSERSGGVTGTRGPATVGDEATVFTRADGSGSIMQSYFIRKGTTVLFLYRVWDDPRDPPPPTAEEVVARLNGVDYSSLFPASARPNPGPATANPTPPPATPIPATVMATSVVAAPVEDAVTTDTPPDDQPLPAETVLAATAASSLILSLGALAQMLLKGRMPPALPDVEFPSTVDSAEATVSSGQLPEQPAEPVTPPSPPPIGFEQNGKVWYEPPWDIGGPYWMDKADYQHIKEMQSQGLVWHKGGWMEPQDKIAYDRAAQIGHDQNVQRVDKNELARQDSLQQQKADSTGVLTTTDQIQTQLWILKNAPTDQARQDMEELVSRMSAPGVDKTLGDRVVIQKALGGVLQKTEQPPLTYVERYSLRDEVMEHALPFRDKRDQTADGIGILTGSQTILSEAGLSELSPGETLTLKGLDVATKIQDSVNYFSGYKAAGDGNLEAAGKTVVQVGLKSIVFSNPIVGLSDTAIKYGEQIIMGRDASPSKLLEYVTNRTMDGATGDLAVKPVVQDFNSPDIQQTITDAQAGAIQKRLSLPDLGHPERDKLTQMLKDLKAGGAAR
ncbi:MAG: hypothetical protein Q7O66_19395 [Dehalococcoidia bacterium]|nr:hypothetical protein [Dehalococcoidia bacterium]